MTRTTMLPLLAAAALVGCNQEDHTIVAGGPVDDGTANASANVDIEMPPSIVGSGKYRCKDNSVISVDWLSDGTANSARVTPEGGEAVTLTEADADGPYMAEGASLTGDPRAARITYNGQSCKK